MASVTDICNMALSHIGVGKDIANIDEDNSSEARACRAFYEISRDALLREFDWPFTRRRVCLALVEEEPNDEWMYSYRYPADALKITRFVSDFVYRGYGYGGYGYYSDYYGQSNGGLGPTRQTRIPYVFAQDDQGILIYSNYEDAEAEFIFKTEETQLFSPDFVLTLSFLLAFHIAPRLTSGDPFGLRNSAFNEYTRMLEKTKATHANEEQYAEEVDSQFTRVRY